MASLRKEGSDANDVLQTVPTRLYRIGKNSLHFKGIEPGGKSFGEDEIIMDSSGLIHPKDAQYKGIDQLLNIRTRIHFKLYTLQVPLAWTSS